MTKNASKSPPKFTFWVGVCFTLNYVVGSGFLTLPWAFEQTGAILGVLVLIVFTVFAIFATLFILEASVRASKIIELTSDIELPTRTDHRGYASISESAATELEEADNDNVILMNDSSRHNSSDSNLQAVSNADITRRIEMTELCDMFLGPAGRRAFSFIIGIYMYGTLWAYCTVFAKAFAVQFALRGEENPDEGSTYYIYLFVFSCVVVPLSLMELSEQIYIQVTLTIFRGVMLVVMLLTIGIAYFSCGNEFGEMSNTSCEPDSVMGVNTPPTSLLYVHFDKLYLFLPIAAYAYIFHHSVPALSEPVEDKASLGKLFGTALVIAFIGYALLGVCVAAYFENDTLSSSNLNWRHFEGVRDSDGKKPWYAAVVSCFVVLFPALDVASAYPLNAFTLGNNLMSAYYGDDMQLHEKNRFKTSIFRLLAAIPPFLGASVVSNLENITAFTGLTGFAIAFVIPPLLGYFSEKRLRDLNISKDTVHTSVLTSKSVQYVLTASGTLLILVVILCQLIFGVQTSR
mmetsp:Transcript_60439/g.118974  ORF Transcript_60439/g.118974 Transcript_60439/m.118974 type:complete len:517 (+) Transcript_60439:45-1595(+)